MISIVPIKHIEASVRPDLQRHRHEPGIVTVEQVWFTLGQITGAIAFQTIEVQGAAVDVAHADAPPVLLGVSVRVQVSDTAISRFLVTVIGDCAQREGKRREYASLPLVVPGLDKMKEMIVRPMTRFDNRTAFAVPGQAVGVARAFRNNLEFPRARMHPPQRAIE